MKYQVGDLLRYKTHASISKRIMYCIVLEARKDKGIVFWIDGIERNFQQTVEWKSYYGTFERAS